MAFALRNATCLSHAVTQTSHELGITLQHCLERQMPEAILGFHTIQEAINQLPTKNDQWITIYFAIWYGVEFQLASLLITAYIQVLSLFLRPSALFWSSYSSSGVVFLGYSHSMCVLLQSVLWFPLYFWCTASHSNYDPDSVVGLSRLHRIASVRMGSSFFGPFRVSAISGM